MRRLFSDKGFHTGRSSSKRKSASHTAFTIWHYRNTEHEPLTYPDGNATVNNHPYAGFRGT